MGKFTRTTGPRLGFRATPWVIARDRAAGFVLLCLFLGLALLLVGACNTQGFPPAPTPGGGPGGGGGQGPQGTGGIGPAASGGVGGSFGPGGPDGGAPGGTGGAGSGDNTDCAEGMFSCVASCAVSLPSVAGSCDHSGSLTCPAGYVRLSTCPETACARPLTYWCCDLTTGAITQATCGPNGLMDNCPSGTLPETSYTCVPPSLGVADCANLSQLSCALAGQQCQTFISCTCQPEGDAGLTWNCRPPVGP